MAMFGQRQEVPLETIHALPRARMRAAVGSIEDRSEFPAFLDLLAWSAEAEPQKLLNAVDFTRGDDDLFAGVELDV